MTSTPTTAPLPSTRRRGALSAAVALAIASVSGCAAGYALEDEGEIASAEQALRQGDGEAYEPPPDDDTAGRTSRGPGYSCSSGTCTCDKRIVNDCEDMSGVCTSGSVDDLIRCIQGWGTTHCTCTQGLTSTPDSPHLPPGGENKLP